MATRRNDDDSSEEEEATAIDLRGSSQIAKKGTPSKSPPASRPSPVSAIVSRTAAPVQTPKASARTSADALHASDDSSDEEATEFLAQRPGSSSQQASQQGSPAAATENNASSLRARGRAVPLEGEDVGAFGDRSDSMSREKIRAAALRATTDPLPQTAPEAVNALPRAPRPLPDRMTDMKSETQTGASSKSAPRITRIFVDPDTHKRIAADAASETDPGDEVTDPPRDSPPKADGPRPRPLPAAGKAPTVVALTGVPLSTGISPGQAQAQAPPPDERTRQRSRTERTSAPSSETLEAEPADGTLIVEVPEGSVVFIDGLERGQGPSLKVKEIDRYAKHAVRIHCPGYLPWSGSVCLEGRTAAKIRPSLKKRS